MTTLMEQAKPVIATAKKILFVAGESSGDTHASLLAKELKQADPFLKIFACGGKALAAEGADMLANLVDLSVVGAAEVLRKYKAIRKVFYGVLDFLDREKPDAVILVDYPGFNLRLAEEAKRRGIGVVYYVSPQIWAWASGRIQKIKRDVDLMLVILPFEQALYERAGVPVRFVGHPSLDRTLNLPSRQVWLQSQGLDPKGKYIALLPGSRAMEVQKLLPIMLEAAAVVAQKYPEMTFLIPCAGTYLKADIETAIRRCPHPILSRRERVCCRLLDGQAMEAAQASDLALVASGTATLETALMRTPMLIVYKVHAVTYLIARMLVKVQYLGLVNVLAGKCIAPEFLQGRAKGTLLAHEALAILGDTARQAEIKGELDKVRESLGEPGASRRAAKTLTHWLGARTRS